MEEMAYDYCSQALLIYEEELSDNEAKYSALNLIVTTLFNLNCCFGNENYDTLVSNSASYC